MNTGKKKGFGALEITKIKILTFNQEIAKTYNIQCPKILGCIGQVLFNDKVL